jgi:putative membrane protein
MKRLSIILAILGVGLGIGLVIWLGAGKIVHALTTVGWSGFGILVGWQLLVIVLLGGAWRVLCPGARLWATIWGRLVREGGTNILPFSELGGLAFSARTVMLGGVKWPVAIASAIADVAAEFIGEIPFILFGCIALVTHHPNGSLVLPLALGVGLIVLAGVALIWAERHSAKLFHAVGKRIAARWAQRAERQADRVEQEFERLLAAPRRMGIAATIHLAGWIGGGVTVWIAYRLLGAQVDLLSCMAIEGLLSCALAIAFLVPAGIGVQEASYVLIGQLFGLPAQLSIGLSFLRRARDIVIGAPALASWQIVEVRHLRPKERAARAGD